MKRNTARDIWGQLSRRWWTFKKSHRIVMVAVGAFVFLVIASRLLGNGSDIEGSPLGDSLPSKTTAGALLPSDAQDRKGASAGLSGMSAVEVHVRESNFLRALEKRSSTPMPSFDLYFLYQDENSRSRAEIVFRRVLLRSMDVDSHRIEILVAETDVPVILALEMLGEYQLVRNSMDPVGPSGSGALPSVSASIHPLRERSWVKGLLGEESVVVVP